MDNVSRYIQLTKQLDAVPIFLQDWWLDTVYGQGKWGAIIIQKDGIDYDGLAYSIEKKWGFSLLRPARLSPYSGNLRINDPESLTAIWQQLPSTSHSIITTFPDQVIPILPNTTIQHHPTYRLPLQGHTPESLFKLCTKERQRHIKTANKHLSYIPGNFDTETFVGWHQHAFTSKGKPYPYDASYIQQLLDAASNHKSVYTLSARLDGTAIAHIACFFDKKYMYYLLGAKNEAYNKYNALSGLLFQAILHAQAIGLEVFDFEGSKDPGIAGFFEKFGAQKTYYTAIQSRPNIIWKSIQRLRNF